MSAPMKSWGFLSRRVEMPSIAAQKRSSCWSSSSSSRMRRRVGDAGIVRGQTRRNRHRLRHRTKQKSPKVLMFNTLGQSKVEMPGVEPGSV